MTSEPITRERFWRLRAFFRFFGIIIETGKKHPVHLSVVFFIWVGAFFVLMLVGGFGMYSYSTNPAFCNSCHIMQPYYKAWETSGHKGKATCVECHYPPATSFAEHLWHKFQASSQVIKYITRTYSSKPFAEIEDASCLRSGCHSTRLLEGKVVTDKGIKFDHRPHLMAPRRGRQLRCVSCHSQIVVGRHVEVTYSSCYLCHFRGEGVDKDKPMGGCLDCHDIPKNDIQIGKMSYSHLDFVKKRGVACQNCHTDAIKGEGRTNPERCMSCHNEPQKLAQFNNQDLIHENHVTNHNIACLHCHDEIQHGLQGQMTSFYSEKGDNGLLTREDVPEHTPRSVTFDCAFCHSDNHTGQLKMYSGRAEDLGLPNIPSPMFNAGVDCIGCHFGDKQDKEVEEFTGLTKTPVSKACVKCHGSSYAGMWEAIQDELKLTLSKLDEKTAVVEGVFKTGTLTEEQKKGSQAELTQAIRLQNFVKYSHGEHNIYLAAAALRKENDLLSKIGQDLNTPLPDLSQMSLMTGGYCESMCHTKVSVQVPKVTVKVDGKDMPHLMHASMMSCVTCHDLGPHKEGPLRPGIRESLCVGCHPTWNAESK